MFASVIWNRHRPLYISARCVSPLYCSRSFGDTDGNVWKCNGIPTSLIACHSGSHCGCHIGSISHEHDSSMPLKPSLATRWTSATAINEVGIPLHFHRSEEHTSELQSR